MVKKENQKKSKNTSVLKEKKAPQTIEKKQKKSFFQDVEFNLYIMIYLLSVVVLLMSGVLFYTSELLNLTNQELKVEQEKYSNYYELRIVKYTLPEFSEVTNENIVNILDLKRFAETENFDEIVLDDFSFSAKKQQTCFFNQLRDIDLCRYLFIEYDAAGDKMVYVTSGFKEP